jgi:hypothetical protein
MILFVQLNRVERLRRVPLSRMLFRPLKHTALTQTSASPRGQRTRQSNSQRRSRTSTPVVIHGVSELTYVGAV